MNRKTQDMIMDNLDLIVWLVEGRTKKPVRTLNPRSVKDDTLEMILDDGLKLSLNKEVVARDTKPLIDLAAEVYGCDTKYLEFKKGKVILKRYPEKIIDIKDFEREMRNALATKIEYQCVLHNIPYGGVENLYEGQFLDILNVYNQLADCIRSYCPEGKPRIPIQFEIYYNGQGNLTSNVQERKRTF